MGEKKKPLPAWTYQDQKKRERKRLDPSLNERQGFFREDTRGLTHSPPWGGKRGKSRRGPPTCSGFARPAPQAASLRRRSAFSDEEKMPGDQTAAQNLAGLKRRSLPALYAPPRALIGRGFLASRDSGSSRHPGWVTLGARRVSGVRLWTAAMLARNSPGCRWFYSRVKAALGASWGFCLKDRACSPLR